jgi:hypothetical protein
MEQQASEEMLLRQADKLRAQARRARRLAERLIDAKDTTRFLAFAIEANEKADILEREAADAKDGVLKR